MCKIVFSFIKFTDAIFNVLSPSEIRVQVDTEIFDFPVKVDKLVIDGEWGRGEFPSGEEYCCGFVRINFNSPACKIVFKFSDVVLKLSVHKTDVFVFGNDCGVICVKC